MSEGGLHIKGITRSSGLGSTDWGPIFWGGGGGGQTMVSWRSPLPDGTRETLRIKDQSCSMLRLSHKAMW